MNEFSAYLRELNIYSLILRLVLAMLLGGTKKVSILNMEPTCDPENAEKHPLSISPSG